MSAKYTRLFHSIHKWSGLITGLNVLLLSMTGAWLVFDEELNHAFPGPKGEVLVQVDPKGPAPVQAALDALLLRYPKAHAMSFFRSKHDTGSYEFFFTGEGVSRCSLDNASGEVYTVTEGPGAKLNRVLFQLHANLLLGFTGTIIISIAGTLFLLSTLTGIVIYGPFMKSTIFGLLRWDAGLRRASSDLHKFIGCLSLAFNVVISVTGIVVTLGFFLTRAWFVQEFATLVREGNALPAVTVLPAVDLVIQTARLGRPGYDVSGVSFPGAQQGPGQYLIYFAKQNSLLRFAPALSTLPVGALDNPRVSHVPWWVKLTYLCIPFHFGNFAGIGMKIVYCIFGLSSGALSITGALLTFRVWLKRWRMWRPRKARPKSRDASPVERQKG